MGRKPGKQDIPKEAAKKQVLELLTQGSTITDAMKAVGRNDVTFRQWSMSDPEFKAEADKSRLAGKGVKADLARLAIDIIAFAFFVIVHHSIAFLGDEQTAAGHDLSTATYH